LKIENNLFINFEKEFQNTLQTKDVFTGQLLDT